MCCACLTARSLCIGRSAAVHGGCEPNLHSTFRFFILPRRADASCEEVNMSIKKVNLRSAEIAAADRVVARYMQIRQMIVRLTSWAY